MRSSRNSLRDYSESNKERPRCWKGGQNVVAEAAKHGTTIYAIKEDLEARGIIGDKIHPEIKAVNYDESISIIMDKYEKVITWC